jgi:hypothetical protein
MDSMSRACTMHKSKATDDDRESAHFPLKVLAVVFGKGGGVAAGR